MERHDEEHSPNFHPNKLYLREYSCLLYSFSTILFSFVLDEIIFDDTAIYTYALLEISFI